LCTNPPYFLLGIGCVNTACPPTFNIRELHERGCGINWLRKKVIFSGK
jgi:hypothetical protein